MPKRHASWKSKMLCNGISACKRNVCTISSWQLACSLSDEAGTGPGNSGSRGRTVFQETSGNPSRVVHGTQTICSVELQDTDERWRRTQHLKRACQMYREEAAMVLEAESEARRAAEATSSRCRERQELLLYGRMHP